MPRPSLVRHVPRPSLFNRMRDSPSRMRLNRDQPSWPCDVTNLARGPGDALALFQRGQRSLKIVYVILHGKFTEMMFSLISHVLEINDNILL